MTIGRGWEVQTAVFSAIQAVMGEAPGYSYVDQDAPARHWRVDGFTVADARRFKDQDKGRHGFTVHVFDDTTHSLQWVRERSAAVHAAVTGIALDGLSEPIRAETASAGFESEDGRADTAHAFIRFTLTLGDMT